MITNPPIDQLTEKAGDKYALCCVVAKHNIRTQNKNVPVIDLKRIKELLSAYPLNTVFHILRNHEYEIPMPKNVSITHQEIEYAGYKFKIPALRCG